MASVLHRSLLRSRTTTVLAAAALVCAGLVTGMLGPGVPQARAVGDSPLVDAPAPYEGQVTCTKAPRPGTVALASWLMRTYPATGSMGLMRGCRVGGRSEHKDGRAFDWKADVRKKKTRRAAYDFIRKALATDAAGNPHALARRMGIMYLIWNDHIYSAWGGFEPADYLNGGCRSLKACSRTLRHRDHVHISLGRPGARAATSWFVHRLGSVRQK